MVLISQLLHFVRLFFRWVIGPAWFASVIIIVTFLIVDAVLVLTAHKTTHLSNPLDATILHASITAFLSAIIYLWATHKILAPTRIRESVLLFAVGYAVGCFWLQGDPGDLYLMACIYFCGALGGASGLHYMMLSIAEEKPFSKQRAVVAAPAAAFLLATFLRAFSWI